MHKTKFKYWVILFWFSPIFIISIIQERNEITVSKAHKKLYGLRDNFSYVCISGRADCSSFKVSKILRLFYDVLDSTVRYWLLIFF
jgi:hypothetical protein